MWPAIPCSVMNLASRSGAEDSNALEITCFAELISELGRGYQIVADYQTYKARIVSQRHDKVFALKMAGKRLFRRFFAFDELA